MAQLKRYEELVDSIPMPNDDREVLRQLLVKVNDSQSVQSTDDVTFNNVEVDGDLNHDGSNVGFFGASPVAQQSALTAQDSATVDDTYGTEESGVIQNNRTRIEELETAMSNLGLIG